MCKEIKISKIPLPWNKAKSMKVFLKVISRHTCVFSNNALMFGTEQQTFPDFSTRHFKQLFRCFLMASGK